MIRSTVVSLVIALFVSSAGCSAYPAPPVNLPRALPSTTVGPGDVFEVHVMGEPNLPKDYRVNPDGTIDFPYVARLMVANVEPQDIASLIRRKLQEAKILNDPQVSVSVKQYNSKKVAIIGQVIKPGIIPYTESLRLVDALSQAGWFTPLSASNHVLLTRLTRDGGSITVEVSVDAITDGKRPDIPLQAGDTIKVPERVF
jgi:polysaccharide export outer membrane protein